MENLNGVLLPESADFRGYSVEVVYRRPLVEAAAEEVVTHVAEVGGSGRFTLPKMAFKTTTEVRVYTRTSGLAYEKQLDELPEDLSITVDAPPAMELSALAVLAVNRKGRLSGRVIERSGRALPKSLQVVILGTRRDGDAEEVVLATKADVSGYFSATAPAAALTRARAVIGSGSEFHADVHLDGTALPNPLLLVVDLEGTTSRLGDCDCDPRSEPARAPDPEDLVNAPEVFARDLGGGRCVDMTAPNRVIAIFVRCSLWPSPRWCAASRKRFRGRSLVAAVTRAAAG